MLFFKQQLYVTNRYFRQGVDTDMQIFVKMLVHNIITLDVESSDTIDSGPPSPFSGIFTPGGRIALHLDFDARRGDGLRN